MKGASLCFVIEDLRKKALGMSLIAARFYGFFVQTQVTEGWEKGGVLPFFYTAVRKKGPLGVKL